MVRAPFPPVCGKGLLQESHTENKSLSFKLTPLSSRRHCSVWWGGFHPSPISGVLVAAHLLHLPRRFLRTPLSLHIAGIARAGIWAPIRFASCQWPPQVKVQSSLQLTCPKFGLKSSLGSDEDNLIPSWLKLKH